MYSVRPEELVDLRGQSLELESAGGRGMMPARRAASISAESTVAVIGTSKAATLLSTSAVTIQVLPSSSCTVWVKSAAQALFESACGAFGRGLC